MQVRGALQLERNLNDDYVKFVRFGQTLIDQAGMGLLGLITSNSYLENITFPGMRNSLAASFASIEIVNLHGSVKTGGTTPNGQKDENVFDIQQGVAISIFSSPPQRTANKRQYADIWGSRSVKEQALRRGRLGLSFREFTPTQKMFLFVPTGGEGSLEYQEWKALDDIFVLFGTGVMTNRNGLTIGITSEDLAEAIAVFVDRRLDDNEVSDRLEVKSNALWDLSKARREIAKLRPADFFRPIDFRPFDERVIFYSPTAVDNMRRNVMDAAARRGNLTLLVSRQQFKPGFRHAFVTRRMFDECVLSAASREKASGFSLLGRDASEGDLALPNDEPNLKASFLPVLPSAAAQEKFCFIYSVLHSGTYRERYADELKRGYPRLPEPNNLALVQRLAGLGRSLVALHLMELRVPDANRPKLVGDRNAAVEKVSWSDSTIWIDKVGGSGFIGVPESVWCFQLGGYRICEKWLKDRKGRTLSKKEVEHYKDVVVAISETIRIMKEIDEVIDEHGGWPGAFATNAAGGRN